MSHCGLGLSCEPIKEDKIEMQFIPSCIHGKVDYCYKCEITLMNKVIELANQIEVLHEHKLRQIDENRKVSRRLEEIENGLIKRIGILGDALHGLSEENHKLKKTPHQCPVCNGYGLRKLSEDKNDSRRVNCSPCQGKGIIWG